MNDLLKLLGKRVHDLRAAKKWSQEEFAHVSGFHRTYIGQIERGEKNISFSNLCKIAGVLGVSLSELLAGLEQRHEADLPLPTKQRGGGQSMDAFRFQKLVKQLRIQQSAMDRVTALLEEVAFKPRSIPRKSGQQRARSELKS